MSGNQPAKSYSEDSIRAAFWKTFKGAGEIWFPYGVEHEAEAEGVTADYWETFREALEGKDGRGV